jgi:large subunit ribosomal protein L23
MDLVNIIKRPILSEKSTLQTERFNQVSFEVSPDATKTQIRHAVEEFFKVKVTAVNTVLVPGPRYRTRVGERKGAPWKKAIVTLKEGEKIEFFKGV